GVASDAAATDDRTVPVNVPNRPIDVSATPSSTNAAHEIDLSWTNNSQIATSFKVQRADAGETNWTTIKTVFANVTSYADTSVFSASGYSYRVIAHDDDSIPSEEALAVTD